MAGADAAPGRPRSPRSLPAGWELWLDGGHNPAAGLALAAQLGAWRLEAPDRPSHLVVGMKASKAAAEFLAPLLPPLADTLWAVAEPGQHCAMPVEDIVARERRRRAAGADRGSGAGGPAARTARRRGCWSAAASIWRARC